ncbi:MAG: hypothetical protein MJ093_00910 [Saccharofermentans sp.]|nr:hypothetical protein [Saccharofermentans sp.]
MDTSEYRKLYLKKKIPSVVLLVIGGIIVLPALFSFAYLMLRLVVIILTVFMALVNEDYKALGNAFETAFVYGMIAFPFLVFGKLYSLDALQLKALTTTGVFTSEDYKTYRKRFIKENICTIFILGSFAEIWLLVYDNLNLNTSILVNDIIVISVPVILGLWHFVTSRRIVSELKELIYE